MTQEIPHIELEPTASPDATVIWLHGLGASGDDFVPAIPELKLPDSLSVRFLFPHAPIRPVTINGGMPMPAWYDILSMGNSREINEAHLVEASEQISSLIEREEARGIAKNRIVLIGFSQGGAVAYRTALRSQTPLAGLAAMSTYRIDPEAEQHRTLESNRKLPVWIAHGDYDDVVPMSLGRQGYESLIQEGMSPQWHNYPMGHEVCLAEIEDLSRWLQKVLA